MAAPEITGRFIMLFDMVLNDKPRTQKRAREETGLNPLALDPDKWYDFQTIVLPYVESIYKQWFGSKNTLGMFAREVFPILKQTTKQLDEFSDPIQIFQNLDDIYKNNLRGDGVGGFECVEATENSVVMKANPLFMTDFTAGFLGGVVKIFEPEYKIDKIEITQRREDGHPHSMYNVSFHRE